MATLGLTPAGTTVSRLGLGCFSYGNASTRDSVRTIRRALAIGINLFDTSDAYGAGANEVMLGDALVGMRSRAFITTKFGWVLDESGAPVRLDGSPAHVRRSCEASLKRLRTNHIDLYVAHRIDPSIPIEETAGELGRLVEEGKVRSIGLSEAGVGTIERAHRTHPLAALQTEYSLWSREPEEELIPLCGRLGMAFIAYSPLGRGFLAGQVQKESDLAPGDFRRTHPRFEESNLKHNVAVLQSLAALAEHLGRTPAQLALGWLMSRPGDVYAIPGTRRIDHLRENLKALEIGLSESDLDAIGEAVRPELVHGERHPAHHMPTIGR